MFGQRFIVIIDELHESAPELQPHLRIDHDLERRRARSGLAISFLSAVWSAETS